MPPSRPFQDEKNSLLGLHDGVKKILKDNVEGKAEKQNQGEDVDLTPHEHGRALKRVFKSFVIPGAPKTDIDSHFDQTKPHIKTLIKNHLKEIGSAKIIMILWVRWKEPVEPLTEFLEDAQDTGSNAVDKFRSAPSLNPSP